MSIRYDAKTLAIAAVALIVATGLLYWGYSAHKKSGANQAILALVMDSGTRLRDALGIESAPPTADRTMFVKKLDEHAAAAELNLQKFKRLDTASVQALADSADDYLVTTREILKRQADSHRYRLLLAESSQALRDHMRLDNRTGTWVQEAVKAKERVNKDYRGYDLAAVTFDKLLGSLAVSQKKIAPYADKAILIEASVIADTHRRVQEGLRVVAAEFEKIGQIAAPK